MTKDTAPPLALDVDDVRQHFGAGEHRVRAVDGVSFRIARGEVVALLGPNGAGKTTTLDMVVGLTEPDAGSIRVLGEPPRRAIAGGRLSAVLQTGGLLADITVRETIEVVAGLHRASRRVDDVIAQAGLGPIAGRRIGRCSGGEQQRVKFALALLPDPDVLVLDEPTAGMDVVARRRFWDVMRADADAGRTIVFATHYLEEAEQFARRTIVLSHGVVVADADTAHLRASLGGRTVSARLPDETPGAVHDLAGEIAGTLGVSGIRIDGDRITFQAADADSLALRLLTAGARDLEITAPTLESAFTTLTEELA
ncbi:ABC transporter ATP-binding protein [Microbacterium sp.]|uniref:ABC transporter ATP-binding protein n=1 Tax=Microbacterium sp. TaxID=51671 RepID=UPI003A8B818A